MKETFDKYVCNKERVRNNVLKGQTNHIRMLIPIAVVMTTLIITFLIGLSYFNNPVSYVSIDINPSIMISSNALDKVVKVEGLNDDAKKVINKLNLYGKDVSTAVNEIVTKATELGYVDSTKDDNAILVSTYCNDENKREQLQERIHNNLNNNLNQKGIKSLIIDTELTSEDASKANEYGVSEAKILFVKKALVEHPELKFEDLIHLPTREIAKYIAGYSETNHNNNINGGKYQKGKK